MKKRLLQAGGFLLVITLICGFLYPAFITMIAQTFFHNQANGSLIVQDNTVYGSSYIAQSSYEPDLMWGRMSRYQLKNMDSSTQTVQAVSPSYGPDSRELAAAVQKQAEWIAGNNPDEKGVPIPADLVSYSASGLDPDISVDAARYQVPRIAKARNISEEQVESIIDKCTTHKLLGLFGTDCVNVLKVNLMLEGIESTD